MTVRIVAIGGTVHPGSTTEMALRYAARPAIDAGAQVAIFGGEYLASLPHYRGPGHDAETGRELVDAVRLADGLIIATPSYHGTLSGLVKNALDYIEDLAQEEHPYLHDRAVGLIATAYGEQASMGAMQTLRNIVHALRGWPTPLGATLRTHQELFSPQGECLDERARLQLTTVGEQVLEGANAMRRTQSD